MAASWKVCLAIRNFPLLRTSGHLLDNSWNSAMTQVRCFPARRGTRERREKIKRAYKLRMAAEKEKVVPKKSDKLQRQSRERISMNHPHRDIKDDCYIAIHHKRKIYSILEAIRMHRMPNHPTMYDRPNAPLLLTVELNMSLEKKNKFMESFSGVIKLPHYFDDGIKKTVMAFCKNDDDQYKAMQAGADKVGGQGLVKKILNGEVQQADYRYVVAHTDIINDMASLRGILKKKMPTTIKKSVGSDIVALVDRFKHGLEYVAQKDVVQHDFGFIDVPIGMLNMTDEQIQENIAELVKAVCTHQNPKIKNFITLTVLICPPSKEKIAIDVSDYLPAFKEDDDDDDEENVATYIRR